jgi:threonine dehydrogenase-like Zn-dependent dehydrogenase
VQRDFARDLGADEVVEEDELARAVRRLTGSLALGKRSAERGRLTGGADVVFDCVGSLARSPRRSPSSPGWPDRPRRHARPVRVDLAPLWQREITLLGAYAYGTEELRKARARPSISPSSSSRRPSRRLVSAHYPLERYEEAVRHAANAGRRGAVKVVFDLRRSCAAANPSDQSVQNDARGDPTPQTRDGTE